MFAEIHPKRTGDNWIW